MRVWLCEYPIWMATTQNHSTQMNTSHRVECGAVSCWKSLWFCSPEGFSPARHTKSLVELWFPQKNHANSEKWRIVCHWDVRWQCECERPGRTSDTSTCVKGNRSTNCYCFCYYHCESSCWLLFCQIVCPIWQMTEWNGHSSPIRATGAGQISTRTFMSSISSTCTGCAAFGKKKEVTFARGKRSRAAHAIFRDANLIGILPKNVTFNCAQTNGQMILLLHILCATH